TNDSAPSGPRHARSGLLASWLLLALSALLAEPAQGSAQAVRVGEAGDPLLDRRIAAVLAADPLIVVDDTTIGSGAVVDRPMLILDAWVYIAGTVRGDVVVVDGNLFLRPDARIEGDVVNAGGGFYRSSLAEVGGEVIDAPVADYAVERGAGDLIIEGRATQEGPLVLERPFGFSIPTYDRVNGLTVGWGAAYRLPFALELRPELAGRALYFSERGDFGWKGELRARLDTTTVRLGAERRWFTNERWIKGDVINSLVFLLKGDDRRDYYDATRYYLELEQPLSTGAVAWTALLGVQREEARTLHADTPWSILEADSVRPNLPVDDGVIHSALAGVRALYLGATSRLELDGTIELAAEVAGAGLGFAAFRTDLAWATRAFRNHTFAVEAHAQGPLPGTDELPLQRWSFVGGSGTLNVFEEARFRGDRVVFVESTYRVPLPRDWRVPYLGRGAVELLHGTGMAWGADDARGFEQQIGAQLRFAYLYGRVLTNPSDLSMTELSIGLKNPIGAASPWESPARDPERP
ncbi:MAG: hypothetical protein ACRELV_08110, partial [Longimicrobiales bacterium]